MRMRLLPDTPSPRLSRVAGLLLLLVSGAGGAPTGPRPGPPAGRASWATGRRRSSAVAGSSFSPKPSLAAHVPAAGGLATEERERAGRQRPAATTGRARPPCIPGGPDPARARLHRACSTASRAARRKSLAIVQRDPDVKGIFPSGPRSPPPGSGHARRLRADGGRRQPRHPGFTGAPASPSPSSTPASTWFIRSSGARSCAASTCSTRSETRARARTRPCRDVPKRHGTEMAGLVAGSDGPAGLEGVAPGAALLPIRVAGWQPDAAGGVSVYGRTDQLLAGLELAVDPNEDGDAHDAARVALVGVVRALRGLRRRTARPRCRRARPRSTRSSSRQPATTARQGRPTAASAGPVGRPRRRASGR